MNYNILYPSGQDQPTVSVYLDTINTHRGGGYIFTIKNRMSLETITFNTVLFTTKPRRVTLGFYITNEPGSADPEVGTIYLDQDGYWDFELYWTLYDFYETDKYIPVGKGSFYFYREVSDLSGFSPEVVYITPDDYDTNPDFLAEVLSIDPPV